MGGIGIKVADLSGNPPLIAILNVIAAPAMAVSWHQLTPAHIRTMKACYAQHPHRTTSANMIVGDATVVQCFSKIKLAPRLM